MSDAWSGLVWFLVLLLVNGFFVGSEFAVMSARRAQIEPLAEAGSAPARITIKAMDRVAIMLATTQIGVTVCSLLILLIAEPSIHELIGEPLHAFGWPDEVVSVTTFVLALVLVSALHVLVGELIPKQLAFAVPNRAALALVPLLYGVAWVLRPIVVVLNALANLVLRIFGVKARESANSAYTIDQVEDIVEHSTREGVLSDTSGTISNTFEFTEKQVMDILVPADRLVSLPMHGTPAELERAVGKHGFSRYPLFNTDGEIEGYLHIKDVLDLRDDELDLPFPAKRIRNLITLSTTTELEDALASMRRVGAHLGRAVHPDGAFAGVVFLEDIIEELVGEVQDATRRN